MKIKKREKEITLPEVMEMKEMFLQGVSTAVIAEKINTTPGVVHKKLDKIDSFMNADLEELAPDQAAIRPKIAEMLETIKEKLSLSSIDIVAKADERIQERLNNDNDAKKISARDLSIISDNFSKRLARLTGIEEFGENSAKGTLSKEKIATILGALFVEDKKDVIDVTPTKIDNL